MQEHPRYRRRNALVRYVLWPLLAPCYLAAPKWTALRLDPGVMYGRDARGRGVTTMTLTYAKVFGPPDDWENLSVLNADTGERIDGVIEVDAERGWLRRYCRDENGYIEVLPNGEDLAEVVEHGNFMLVRRDTKGAAAE